MRTTVLSIISPPRIHNSPVIDKPPDAAGLEHALVVDFRKADSLNTPTISSKFKASSRAYSLFLRHLQSIMQRDGREDPQIDTIRLYRSLELPDGRLWKLLKGLCPRHFMVHSSWDEECILEPLEQLNWTLESLTISSACGEIWDLPSNVVQHIPSLTLDYCSGLRFTPATEPSALRHLTITKNDAIGMFVDSMKSFGVAPDLQTLKLENVIYYRRRGELGGFCRILEQCISLISLDLAICEPLEVRGLENESSSDERPRNGYVEDMGSEGEGYLEILSEDCSGEEGIGLRDGSDGGEGYPEILSEDCSGEEGIGLRDGSDGGDEVMWNYSWWHKGADDEDSNLQTFLDILPQHFPENLEHLRFRCRGLPGTVSDLSIWHQCAVNPSWVPHLKTLSFKLDVGISPPGIIDAELQVEHFFRLLSESRPAVQIIR